MRFLVAGNHEDVTRSIACYKEGAQSHVGRPLLKLTAALQWARFSTLYDAASALDAYQHVMAIIPQVVWLGSTTDRRFESITSMDNAAMEAATTAILVESFDFALEWLEQGRSIVWNQLLQLRTPIDQLAAANPPLAERLKQVARDLEHASFSSNPRGEMPLNQEQVAQQHRRLAEKWESLVEQARLIPGFDDFLRPMKRSRLVEAAHSTSIAMIIVHPVRCDALIIRQGDSNLTHLKLTSLTFEKVAKARAQLLKSLQRQGRSTRGVTNQPKGDSTIGTALRMLWEDLAQPILDLLGYVNILPLDNLPHITWCLTGPLTFLPLHAAGDYGRPGCALSDYAISSYAPNLSCLLASPPDPSNLSGIAAVGQASTPGFDPLPGTRAELDRISLQANRVMHFTRLEGDCATPSAVLAAMEQHSWVHLACHASQNPKKPTASAFHLHEGPLSLATVTQKQLKHADLAFLSACQTATGDLDLPEEAVHLAAGMIMAGYRRVIATMWSIHDIDAPLVADRFYAYMLDNQAPSANKAARALHYAVGCLRAEFGVKEFARWAPFIHIGL
ncbi:hypothetical protein FRC08_016265 [Ceratobasidium sp. 394]|nr:hypothetical protein FRC08_016265 [Ceratobasidium sp. 394]